MVGHVLDAIDDSELPVEKPFAQAALIYLGRLAFYLTWVAIWVGIIGFLVLTDP